MSAVVALQDPLFVPQLMAHVGPAALADWMLHVGGLAAFSTLNAAGAHKISSRHARALFSSVEA